jgi:hypothetical protein
MRKSHENQNRAPTTTSNRTSGITGDGKRARSAAPESTGTEVPYSYRRVKYHTKAALIIGYLDAHQVFTGTVRPPSVADFVRDTGVLAGHGMYGARLHEYCHTPRPDERGSYIIDRNAFRKGATDGRLYVEPEEPHHELSAHA